MYHLAVVDTPLTPLQTDLVAMLEAMRRAERMLFEEVPPDAREQPGAIGEWSVKDVRAHLAAWRAIEARRLGAGAAADEAEPAHDPGPEVPLDEANATLRDRYTGWSWDAVAAEADASVDALIAAIRRSSTDVLCECDEGSVAGIGANGVNHAVGHLPEIADLADGEAHFVLGAALALSGNPTEALREKELAKRLSSTFEQWDRRPAADPVPKGLERVNRDVELPRTRRLDVTLAGRGQSDQLELARFYLDRGRRLFEQQNDREAIAELNRALYLSPYLAEAHLLAGRVHLRSGRAHEAVDALKISIWSAESVDAHIVLGDAYLQLRDVAAARAEAERALALVPTSAEARRILEQAKP